MFISCWSAKGGAGTTVTAASLALVVASREPTLLVDLAGDLPTVLGLPEPEGPGVVQWLDAGAAVAPDALARLEIDVVSGLTLLPRGSGELDHTERAELFAALLGAERRPVVIDCGCLGGPLIESTDVGIRRQLAMSSSRSLLVTRSCYLALRRAVAVGITASGVVLIEEPGRSLRVDDIEQVLGIPVVSSVPWESGIARAVDAGLLANRLPRQLSRALASAA